MASYEYLLNCSTQVRNSCSTNIRHGYSKAQICLLKILHTITSIPPLDSSIQQACLSSRGIGFDLNLRVGPVSETGESESFAENGIDGSVIETKIDGEEVEAVREKSVEVSEVTNPQVESFNIDENGADHEEVQFGGQSNVKEENGKGVEGDSDNGIETVPFERKGLDCNNSFDLLIEAARLISGKDESDSEGPTELETGRTTQDQGTEILEGRVSKRKQSWMAVDLYGDLEDTSPIVKSKRGRSQVLPYRYRDSVLEPWKRSGRPQRPSSTTVHSKRVIGS
ncbi:coiled-coil domain-containing protein 96-like [Quillaja saponaria]|uniref:Coiled-coil domain-containing protein 96-like n=1 Tax=Quillaja saponaria TaxID=32244 RepID=A0AAD7PAB5_QUISA|nr:coiled-coil domain-containing protein 96-like [Quillaja saponaria]